MTWKPRSLGDAIEILKRLAAGPRPNDHERIAIGMVIAAAEPSAAPAPIRLELPNTFEQPGTSVRSTVR